MDIVGSLSRQKLVAASETLACWLKEVQMQILDGVTTVAHHRIVSMGCTCSKFSLRGGSRAFVIPAWICLVMQNGLPNGCTVLNWLLPEHARQLFFCCNLLNLLYSPDFHCLDVMEFMDIIRTFMQHFPKTPLSLRSAAVLAAPGPGCQRRVTIDTLTAISDPILDDNIMMLVSKWEYWVHLSHAFMAKGLELEASMIKVVLVQMLLTFSGAKPGSAIAIQNDLAIHMNIVSERLAASFHVSCSAEWWQMLSIERLERKETSSDTRDIKGQSQACLVHVFAPGPLETNALVQLLDILLRTWTPHSRTYLKRLWVYDCLIFVNLHSWKKLCLFRKPRF